MVHSAEATRSVVNRYVHVPADPGARTLFAVTSVGRLAVSTYSLGVVLMARAHYPTFVQADAYAGAEAVGGHWSAASSTASANDGCCCRWRHCTCEGALGCGPIKRGDFETIQVNGRTAVLTLPLRLDAPDVELPGPDTLGVLLGILGRPRTAGRGSPRTGR